MLQRTKKGHIWCWRWSIKKEIEEDNGSYNHYWIFFLFYNLYKPNDPKVNNNSHKIWCCWLLRDTCQCQWLKALGFCVMWCSDVIRSNFPYKSKLFKTYLNYVDYGDGIVYSPINCMTWTTTIIFDVWMSITIFNIFTFMIDFIMMSGCFCFCYIKIGLFEVFNTFGITLI